MISLKLTGAAAEFFVKLFAKKANGSKKQCLSMNALLCSKRLTRASNAIHDCSIVVFNRGKRAKFLLEPDYNPERRYSDQFISNLRAVEFYQVEPIVLMLFPIKVIVYLNCDPYWRHDNREFRAYLSLLNDAHGVSPARRALVLLDSCSSWKQKMFNSVNLYQKPLDYLCISGGTRLRQLMFKTTILKIERFVTFDQLQICSGCFTEGMELKLVIGMNFRFPATNHRVQERPLLSKVDIDFSASYFEQPIVTEFTNCLFSMVATPKLVLNARFYFVPDRQLQTEIVQGEEPGRRLQRLKEEAVQVVVDCAVELDEFFDNCVQTCDQNECSLQMSVNQSIRQSHYLVCSHWRRAIVQAVPGFQEAVKGEERFMLKLEIKRQIDNHSLSIVFIEAV